VKIRRGITWALAELLAVALAVFWAGPAAAAVSIKKVNNILEVSGGTGSAAWTVRYGTPLHVATPRELAVNGNHVWFSHDNWLRRMDLQRGVVTGRWRFPWQISRLTPQGGGVRVEMVESLGLTRTLRREMVFDAAHPRIPSWPRSNNLHILPITEATSLWRISISGPQYSIGFKIAPEHARQAIPEVERAIARDPLSPWFHVVLGIFRQAAGDSRASEAFRSAARLPGADFTELLRISALLSQVGQGPLAAEAFERGYRDFWERGNDPRLFFSMWSRRALFPHHDVTYDGEFLERAYRLAPNAEGAADAWRLYAGHLQDLGRGEEARQWRARAAEARPLVVAWSFFIPQMVGNMGFMACLFALTVHVATLYLRHRPQRRLDLQARANWWSRRCISFLHLEYARPPERAALFGLAMAIWITIGLLGAIGEEFKLTASVPPLLGQGSLAGPALEWYADSRLRDVPERKLLLAFGHQESGDDQKAAPLYRETPQFAESWNNLGVLLRKAGKESEAREAFRRALELDSSLGEAALNQDGRPRDFWTREYARLFPGRPMPSPPRTERFERAMLNRTRAQAIWQVLAGPLARVNWSDVEDWYGHFVPQFRRSALLVLSMATLVWLALPRLRTGDFSGSGSRIAELLLPGTSREWLWAGGLFAGIVTAAFVFSLQLAVPATFDPLWREFLRGTPDHVLAAYSVVGQPVLWPYYAAPAVIFGLNLFLVIRAWRRPPPAV
jgi:tetratricopeptide (TPR) repeat protein